MLPSEREYDFGALTLKSKVAGSVILYVEHNTDSTSVKYLKADTDCNGAYTDYKFSGGDIFHLVKVNLKYGATTDEVYEKFLDSDAYNIIEPINNAPGDTFSASGGMYSFGVRDVYLKRLGGVIFASYDSGMSIEISDKGESETGISSSFVNNHLLLRKPENANTCGISLLRNSTLNKIMILDLDADTDTGGGDEDFAFITSSKVAW